MNKGSMIFKMMCLALCFAVCLSSLPVFAEEIPATETEEVVADVADTDETAAEENEEEINSEENEELDEEDVEVVDLSTATFRDNGVFVTPGDENDTVFKYDSLRYRTLAGETNIAKIAGFEDDVTVWTTEISSTAKNTLQANAEVTTASAHSGYFGLAVKAGEVVYRVPVTSDEIYVFSMWMKYPTSGSIVDSGRAFTVVGDNGDEYIVGYNEIGRDVDKTSSWQQVLFTFKAPVTGLFTIDFEYKGSQTLYIDDVELYEAELFYNPLTITNIECKEPSGNDYNYSTKFTESGKHTHTTTLYNASEDDIYFVAVCVLYKDDIMVDFQYSEECALVLDETEVEFTIDIPDDGNLSSYKYMVYFISDSDTTQFYGETQSRTNPYVVQGK